MNQNEDNLQEAVSCESPQCQSPDIQPHFPNLGDAVERDMLFHDWNEKKPTSRKGLVLFFVIVLIMVGGYLFAVYGEPSDSLQQSTPDFSFTDGSNPYESIMTPESKALFEKMQAQMDTIEQQKQDRERKWLIAYIVCGVVALIPTLKVIIDYLRGKLPRTTLKNGIQTAVLLLIGAVVLFFINLGWFYFHFSMSHSEQMMAFNILIILAAVLLWYYARKASRKDRERREREQQKND